MGGFQINTKSLFITWSQDGENTIDDIEQWIRSTFSSHKLKYWVIGAERHADTGSHHHTFIQLGKSFRNRDQFFADINGHHPRIESARNSNAAKNYCKKDGDFRESDTDFTDTGGGGGGLGVRDGERYIEYLVRCNSESTVS